MNPHIKLERRERSVGSYRMVDFFLNGYLLGQMRGEYKSPLHYKYFVYGNAMGGNFQVPAGAVRNEDEAEAWLTDHSPLCRSVEVVLGFVDKMIELTQCPHQITFPIT